jgi:hypothetical protein
MEYTSYQLVSENSQSLNTGSYLNSTEYAMFARSFAPDLWYGLSTKDVIEIGLWDRDQTLVGWNTIYMSESYDTVTVSYFNTLNNVVSYSYQELKPDFILHSTKDILVDPSNQVSQSFNVPSGSYFITYNMSREMAGSPTSPLVIQDISPSRKELKLVPQTTFDDSYTAFCQHKFIMNTVSPLYVQSVKNCPYGNIYNQVAPLYTKQINTIKALFFIPSDGQMLTFFKNLYEDLLMFSSTPIVTVSGLDVVSQNFIRIQGINTYFNNYLLSNSTAIADFETVDSKFHSFVSASIERKFSAAGPHPEKAYVEAKAFVYDFFTKYFYDPISKGLSAAYKEKYFAYFKNALNLGNNRLLPILSIGYMDERTLPTDPLTLLLKLKDELPNELSTKSTCWVSNISITPFVISAILKANTEQLVHTIGPPNFSIPIPNASLTNTNVSYTANDLKEDDETERQLTISRNIADLTVDYTDFNNFVVFSSAELRLKIFKNKMISLCGLTASVSSLETKANRWMTVSGSVYPYYTQEYTTLQGQMDEIINTFDGYESYLYRQGYYTYATGAFVSASYVADQDQAAAAYDKNNRDSLINSSPQHVLANSDNDDYIIFLSMVGHFFDTLYVYIANLPAEKVIGQDATSAFTRRVVDYMLETFGWKLDDSLEQSNLLNNYLTDQEVPGLNAMSAEDRLKVIRNRVLSTLPQIYKTKGTEEAVRLVLACYGIPNVLLSVREYGGVVYDDPKASYTLYERVYMRQWDTSSRYDSYDLNLPTGSYTYLFKVAIDDPTPYTYGAEQTLFGRVETDVRNSVSASGAWGVGFVRIPKKNTGKIWFRIGYNGAETFKLYSQEFPLFDGNIYSVMLRRNFPDLGYEFDPNYDAIPAKYDLWIKRNDSGNQLLDLTSSAVCYLTASNIQFGAGGKLRIGGWFADVNAQGFTGCFDKFQVWKAPLPDSNMEDYTNNFSAYAFRGDTIPYETLMFRMHTDYPFNQLETGMWVNGNPYLATGSAGKLDALYSDPTNVDYIVSTMAWSGSTKIVEGPCGPVSESVYPFQFKVFNYPSTWGISKYGPNKFRNEKTRYVSQSIEARFDNLDRSTFVDPNATAPDSNQVGFFVDPQDFKNRDIVRYFGNFDFMDVIGDPGYEFSQSYDALRVYRNEYATNRNAYSGSRTLFNELQTIYKLYFNRSVFESIKNVIPARANALLGVVIEPTILERPKYQLQPITTSFDASLVAKVGHYSGDSGSLVGISGSIIPSQSIYVDLSGVGDPTRDYPVNYGGNYIRDLSDEFELGHFASGVPSRTVDFVGRPLFGYAPLGVTFTNLSFGPTSFIWDFGDGQTSTDHDPVHIYDNPGIYTVILYGYYGAYALKNQKLQYIQAIKYIIVPDFTADHTSGQEPQTIQFTNLSTGATAYSWSFGSASLVSTDVNPTFTYTHAGLYTVTLTAYAFVDNDLSDPNNPLNAYASTSVSTSYISISAPPPPPATCFGPYMRSGYGDNGNGTLAFSYLDPLGTGNGDVTVSWSDENDPVWYRVVINNAIVFDSGWLCTDTSPAKQTALQTALLAYPTHPVFLDNTTIHPGFASQSVWTKNTTQPYATVFVYAPMTARFDYTQSCPVYIPPSFPCGGAISATGNQVPYPYYTDYPVFLGNPAGNVTLDFNAHSVPDKFQVIVDGTVMLDTGWAGVNNSTYRNGLNALGFTDAIITYNNTEPGQSSLVFAKPVSVNPVATVRVWSPLGGTAWTFLLHCPV